MRRPIGDTRIAETDKLSNGRSYKMLTVLDEYTRQALRVAVDYKMGSAEVLEALYPLIFKNLSPSPFAYAIYLASNYKFTKNHAFKLQIHSTH